MGKLSRKTIKDTAEIVVAKQHEGSLPVAGDTRLSQDGNLRKTQNFTYCLATAVSLTTFLVYLSSLQNGFVQVDDPVYVLENPPIRSLNAALLTWAFSSFYAANWHPLTWIAHAIDYAVWGLNPLGHHLTNNILHSFNTFIVVLVIVGLFELFKQRASAEGAAAFPDDRKILITAGVTGLLFGLHPIHVESVAWVAERKDLLCAFFFLLSIMAYLKYLSIFAIAAGHQNPASRFLNKQYLLAFVFFTLALLSKPMAVSLPVVLLIVDWYPSKRVRSMKSFWPAGIEKLPFIAVSLMSSVLTILAQRAGQAMGLMENMPLSSRVLVAAKALIDYLLHMIWPANLSPKYPYPRNIELFSVEYLLPLFLLFMGTVCCILLLKKGQEAGLAASLFFVVTLLPVLGIVQVGGQAMADRYTYLPSLGPFLLLGIATASGSRPKADTLRNWRLVIKPFTALVAGIVLVCMVYLTFKQIGTWKNDINLWTSAIEASPLNNFAYFSRGVAFHDKGRLEEAIADYNRSIALEPFHPEAFYLLGRALSETRRLNEAINNFTIAIYIEPGFARAYTQRGLANFYAGRYDLAIQDLDKGVQLDPNSSQAYMDRGTVYLDVGNTELALFNLQKACELGDTRGCNALQSAQISIKKQGK